MKKAQIITIKINHLLDLKTLMNFLLMKFLVRVGGDEIEGEIHWCTPQQRNTRPEGKDGTAEALCTAHCSYLVLCICKAMRSPNPFPPPDDL